MTVSPGVAAPIEEILGSVELAPRNGFRFEPRCRVCRDHVVCRKVNHLLATGASYAFIVRSLAEDNAQRDERDRVTVDSVRNHCGRHFPVQQATAATYREILERRAEENRVDFVQGVATALTPIAFYEAVMNKAFRRLVEEDAEVSVDTGLRAAEKLQSFLDRRAQGPDVAMMWVKLDQAINAVKSVVPEEMWGAIVEKLESERHSETLNVRTGALYGGTDTDELADFDDELETASRGDEEAERRHHEAYLARVEGRRAPTRTIEAPSPAIREFTPKTVKDEDEDDI
jgi:hypothetical protein